MPINIALAYNEKFYRKGLLFFLNEMHEIDVLFDMECSAEVLESIEGKQLNLLLLDIDHLAATECSLEGIRKKYPSLKILVFSNNKEKDFILKAFRSGANGFIIKNDSLEQIVTAIKDIVSKGYYHNHQIEPIIFSNSIVKSRSQKATFTKRELEIIKLMSIEKTNIQIAEKLFINVRTVHRHRENIRLKINAKNASGVILYAIKNNLID